MAAMTDAKALGVHSMWGFSPAADLLENFTSNQSSQEKPIRVLLSRPSDIRHLLATISKRRRHKMPPIHFVVVENELEVIARHLLLLQVACDWELPIRQRATVFLELFGNALVQERTQRYIQRLGEELVELVCDEKGNLADMVDLSALKYRERDQLVETFKSWDAEIPYDAVGLRDHRIRAHFGDKFDNRVGVVDWDYQMRVKPAASIIHSKLYREWRMTGVAYEFGDQKYDQPNRTMGSFAEGVMKKGKFKGMKKEIRGFWVDVVNSPYMSFGVDTDKSTPYSSGLFDIQNEGSGVEQHRHHTVEVSVFNMLSYLWEMETGEKYSMTSEHDIYSGLGEDASDMAFAKGGEDPRRQQALQRARCIVETFADVQVSFVRGKLDDLFGKAAYSQENAFDIIYLSGSSAHHLNESEISPLFAKDCKVIVENGKFIVPISNEQETLLDTRITEMAEARGLKKVNQAGPGRLVYQL